MLLLKDFFMSKKLLCLFVIFLSFASYAASNAELERIIQAQGQLLTDNQQKISDLQYEVDKLRGQLEETTYQLNQTIERQRDILKKLDGKVQTTTSTTTNNTSASSGNANNANTLAGWSPTGNEKADYNFIIKFVLAGQESKEGINAFQQFLKAYPKSSYRANVNYWLGQLCYGQGRKDDASFYYATVVKNFPKSEKAADSLYKVGLILLEKGEKTKAKAVLQQVVSQYPNNQTAVNLAKNKLSTLD